jgi:hypothetical protein
MASVGTPGFATGVGELDANSRTCLPGETYQVGQWLDLPVVP